MWPNPQFPADLVTLTEEIPNGKLHFLCNVTIINDLNMIVVATALYIIRKNNLLTKGLFSDDRAGIYLFKVSNGNARKKCEICSKLIIEAPAWRCSGAFIVSFQQISRFSGESIVDFELGASVSEISVVR